jgi:hypothetical protein
MALSAFVDAFNIGTGAVASTVVRTGYSFQPKACIYWWSGRTESVDTAGSLDLKGGIGVATSATDRRCVTVQSVNGVGTSVTDRKHNNAQCIECLDTAGAVDGNADLQSFDAGGQTLVIDDQFVTSLRVHCLALGGTDLTNAATFQFQAPLATGNADVTSLSFQPDAILLFSVGYATAPPAVTVTNLLSIGVATGAGAQGVIAGIDPDAFGTITAGGYGYGGECVALQSSSTAVAFRASFVSFLSNGFRLNWLEVDGATQPYVMGLALKGGSYLVGDLLTQTDTTTPMVEASFGFQPTALFFLGYGKAQSTQDTATNTYALSLGAATSPSNRGAQGVLSKNGPSSSCGVALEHDACYVDQVNASPGTLDSLLGLQSIDSGGFTAIMDDADSVQSYVTYLAMGNAVITGNQYTITPSGGLMPSAALLKQALKAAAGGMVPNAALLRLSMKTLAGGLVPPGLLVRQPHLRKGGGLTPASTLSVLRTLLRTMTGVLTPAGGVLKQVGKILVAVVVPVGVLGRAASRLLTLAGTLTGTGSLARAVSRVLGGVLTPAGVLGAVRTLLRSFAGVLTPVSTVGKASSKVVSGSLAAAAVLVKSAARTLTGSLVPVGSLRKALSVARSGALTPAAVLAVVRAVLRTFAGTLTPVGSMARQIGKPLSAALTPTAVLVRFALKSVSGMVPAAATLVTVKAILRAFTGVLAPVGGLARQTGKRVSGVVALSGSVVRGVLTVLRGTLSPVGAVGTLKAIQRVFAGTLQPSGALVRVALKGLGGVVVAGGVVLKSVVKVLTGVLASVGVVGLQGGEPQPGGNDLLLPLWRRRRRQP